MKPFDIGTMVSYRSYKWCLSVGMVSPCCQYLSHSPCQIRILEPCVRRIDGCCWLEQSVMVLSCNLVINAFEFLCHNEVVDGAGDCRIGECSGDMVDFSYVSSLREECNYVRIGLCWLFSQW